MTTPPRVLLVAGRHPWPPRRGDQMRADQFVRALAREHAVTALIPERPGAERPELGGVRIETYRRDLLDRATGVLGAALGGRPLQAGLFASRHLTRKLRVDLSGHDLVVLQLVRSCGLLPELGDAPLVVDFVDALSLGFARRAALESFGRRRPMALEAQRLRRWERIVLERSAAACVVAERDRRALLDGVPAPHAGKLGVVPLAIEGSSVRRSRPDRPRLVLTGNLGYFVNRDAVLWFLRRVWPGLRSARPELELMVAGSRTGALARRVREAGAVLVEDPADLRALVAGASVALAPMRCGSGVPVKVLEAWAVGVPVVVSPWAAAGLDGAADEHYLEADEPEEWRRRVTTLLDHPDLGDRLAENAARQLRQRYSFAAFEDALRRTIALAVGAPRTACGR